MSHTWPSDPLLDKATIKYIHIKDNLSEHIKYSVHTMHPHQIIPPRTIQAPTIHKIFFDKLKTSQPINLIRIMKNRGFI